MFEKTGQKISKFFEPEKGIDLFVEKEIKATANATYSPKKLKPEYRKKVEAFDKKVQELVHEWAYLGEKGGAAIDAEIILPADWYEEEIYTQTKLAGESMVVSSHIYFSRFYNDENHLITWLNVRIKKYTEWLQKRHIEI